MSTLESALSGNLSRDWKITVAGSQESRSAVDESSRAAEADPSVTPAALDESDDASLVRACLDGRREAFDVIVGRHRRTVYHVCYRFAGNQEDASELAQDVFLRAYRGLAKFQGQSSLSTWLYRIAVNVSLNHVSVKRPDIEAIDPERHIDRRSESAADRLMRAERAERVRRAIAKLPDKQRTTLVLRIYQELSHEEIATVLGSSVGAVKANFFHALSNLKRVLAGEV